MLTAIQRYCFQFNVTYLDNHSPLKKPKYFTEVVARINDFILLRLPNDERNSTNSHCNMDIFAFKTLFSDDEYSKSLDTTDSHVI